MMAPAVARILHVGLFAIAVLVATSAPRGAPAQTPDAVDVAIRDLGASNFTLRLLSVEILRDSKDPRAVEPLLRALQSDPSNDVREQTAVALGKIRDTRAVEPLISAMRDREKLVRAAAMAALGSIGDPRGVPPLMAELGGDDGSLAQFALAAIGAPAVDALEAAVTHRDRGVRGNALRALVQIGVRREPAFGALVRMLDDSSRYNRAWAAEELGKSGDRRATSPLIARLKDREESVRRAVATGLGSLGDASALDPLKAAIDDRSLDVRRAAAASFLQLFDIRVSDRTAALMPMLADRDSVIRAATAQRLGESGWPQAIEPLAASLRGDESSGVRVAAAGALGRIATPLAVPPLAAALDDPDAQVRDRAFTALGAIGDATAIAALIGALSREVTTFKDYGPNARYRAVIELIRIGAPAVEPLVAALRHDARIVRGRAAESLEGIKDARAVEPLLMALDDESMWVRMPAARFLVTFSSRPGVAAKLDASLDKGDLPVVAAVYPYYLRRGKSRSEETLAAALAQYGEREMAQDFLNCGNALLEKAGSEWAVKHKYRIVRGSKSSGPVWGSAR